MGTPWVVSRCPKYAWFDRTPALRIMMFQRIPSVLKEFVLQITRPIWLRMTRDEHILDLRVKTRRTVPISNFYLETSKLRVLQNST